MEVSLSPRFLLVCQDESLFLVDRRSNQKVWPEDIIQPFPTWGFRPAAEHARRMARSAMLKPEQRELVERFCASTPDTDMIRPEIEEPELRRLDP